MDIQVVDDISFTVAQGGVLSGFLGLYGMGKGNAIKVRQKGKTGDISTVNRSAGKFRDHDLRSKP